MKRFSRIILVFAFLSLGYSLTSTANEASKNPEVLMTELRSEYEELRRGVYGEEKKFDVRYGRELKELEEQAISSGDLELVMAIREVAKHLDEDKAKQPAISARPELARLQKIYMDQMARIKAAQNRKLTSLATDYESKLTQLRVELTKDGQIDAALKVQKEIDEIKKGIPVRAVVASPPKTSERPASAWDFQQGLVVTEYHRVETQMKDKGFVEYSALREKPVAGEKRIIKNLTGWGYTPGKNAISVGYLKIDQPGEYQFSTNSFYDRNALYIQNEDKALCGYRDGEGKIQKITLSKGMVRLISIGYVDARGSCQVRWKPPRQDGLSAIPAELLFHTDADKR